MKSVGDRLAGEYNSYIIIKIQCDQYLLECADFYKEEDLADGIYFLKVGDRNWIGKTKVDLMYKL